MVETPAGLVHLAPARLGRADRDLRREEDRRAPARPGGDRPDRRRVRGGGGRCLVHLAAEDFLGNGRSAASLRGGPRHRRCLVRFRLDPRLRAGAPEGARLAGLALSRGLRPASRLVPLLPAGILRHARPSALRGGPDPWLHARWAGPQNVEIARQRGGAPGCHRGQRCRHPAALGRVLGLFRRPADRQGDPAGARSTSIGGSATRCAISWARSPASSRQSVCRWTEMPGWNAGSCTAWPNSTA